ncbi:hypothetical protein [Streptomyces sp. NPDC048350]|uniref:hypothetical protein n=1 Tax=Streptomyces sp. NPDC048350 TaxID=3365538 RepID=UPI003717FFBE
MQRKIALKTAAILIGAGAVLGSSPAMAKTMDSYATGAHAWSYGTNTKVALQDTKADGDSVYVNYFRTSSSSDEKTLHNKGGNGTVSYSPAGSSITKIQACLSLDFESDSCDSWRS